MSASSRPMSVRHALIILVMILSVFVAVERAQAVVNGVQHALAIDHGATTLAFAAAERDHGHDHDQGAEDRSTDAGEQERAPGSHHHHAEGPQAVPLTSAAIVEVAGTRSDAIFMRADTGSPQSRIFGLERPPKALSDRA